MIDLYTWRTPNGRKVSLMLEEIDEPYRVIPIDIGKGEQFAPHYVALNPNAKIPTIVDHAGPNRQRLVLFESGAILQYLAQKSGRFLPEDPHDHWRTLQWLQFQTSSLGPLLGQAQHFLHYAGGKDSYASDRYAREAARLYGVLERQLAQSRYLGGDTYTIADIATWPWIRPWKIQGIELERYPHVARWLQGIESRPAAIREREVLAERVRPGPLDAQAKDVLFGTDPERSGGR